MVQKLLRRCADCGAVLVVDECFLDFLAARDALTAKTILRDAPNLIILKAFTSSTLWPECGTGVCAVQ